MAQQNDTDAVALKSAAEAVAAIDLKYRLGDANVQDALYEERERVFAAYSLARLNLLREGTVTTDADIQEMRRLKRAVDDAADTQDLVTAAVHLVRFFVRLGV